MSQRSFNVITIPAGLIGILAGAACTADWLTNSDVANLLWPTDINDTVIELLGGTGNRPEKTLQLSVLSVALRFLGLPAICVAIACLFRREPGVAEMAVRLLTRLGLVGVGCGIIWGVQPLGGHEFGLAVPTLVMMLTGTALYCCVSEFLPESVQSEFGSSRLSWILMLSVTAVWIGISFRLNERLYANLLIPHGDSAMYEEHLWNFRHGKGFRSFLDQGLFLGEHIQVIHLLLIPVHMIWPTHLTLELAESVALGSCTIPLFFIVRQRCNDDWAACLVAISWLFFFPMHFLDIAIDQKTFRPICLGLPFLFWMIQAAESGRYRRAWLFLFVALSAKEDMALITAPIGAVIAISAWYSGSHQRLLRNWGLITAAISAVWLLLAVLIVIPAFRSGDVVHYSRYFGDLGSSPGELIRTALTKPGLVLAQIFSFRTLLYAVVLLAPVGFVSVRSLLKLAAGSLTFFMLCLLQLDSGPNDSGLPPVPYHHFHAPLLPVLFWAVAYGTAANRSRHQSLAWLLPPTPVATALLVFCCCLTTGITGSLLPFGAAYWSEISGFGRHALFYPRENVETERALIRRAEMAEKVVAQIPATARVASTDFIHPRLTHCERSYDYSNYERVVNEDGKRIPADCEFIVIDTGHRYSLIRRPAEIPELQETDTWKLLPDETDGCFLILQRRTE
ncbi:MAG: DUF2079 domain-containing protein [Fuerstiella sp.]|nr:DUF2079 domain-containing protein [Fuerstiella sp.]